ncbi:MAG: hypothetical protein K2X47_19120 [Bdellovibrionales bacterium]|nr:hypothetical protein [Bdellovibrionales bacterium]
MGKTHVPQTILLGKTSLAVIATIFPFLAHAQNISDKVNVNLKDTQWKIDFEKEVRTNEALALPMPKNFKAAPSNKHSVSTFGVMNHEENSHFDARPSFDPKKSPSIGSNLNSWAEHSVDAYRKSQTLSTARQAEWLRSLKANALANGYTVKVDESTRQVQLIPIKKTNPARTSTADRKPGSRPAGF